MISIVKKKNKLKIELLSKIEWACSLNDIKLKQKMIFEDCLRTIEHANIGKYVIIVLFRLINIDKLKIYNEFKITGEFKQ